jgi:H+/Na+-translocating ferredoxin:NAD+ oxidoreductase subunit G
MNTVTEPAYRKRLGYQAGLLGGFALLSAALLIIGNLSTHAVIEKRLDEDLQSSLERVIPASLYTNNLLDGPLQVADAQGRQVQVYRGIKEHQVTAVAFRIFGNGYAGEIELILGVDSDGKILGVRVLSHAETPGLGDKIEDRKSDWILGFDGRSLENTTSTQWRVKKDGGDFDQFTGATITPRGVVKAIHQGLEFYRQHRGELLAMSQTAANPAAKEP